MARNGDATCATEIKTDVRLSSVRLIHVVEGKDEIFRSPRQVMIADDKGEVCCGWSYEDARIERCGDAQCQNGIPVQDEILKKDGRGVVP